MAGLMWRIRNLLRRKWSALWRTKNVPFGKRTAEKYVAVGKRFDGISAHDRAQLPTALNTLCCLADLSCKKIEELIGEGRIHPALKLREAQALVAGFPPESRHTTSRSKLQRRLDGFAEFVRENLKVWSPKERQLVVERLAALAGEIRTSL